MNSTYVPSWSIFAEHFFSKYTTMALNNTAYFFFFFWGCSDEWKYVIYFFFGLQMHILYPGIYKYSIVVQKRNVIIIPIEKIIPFSCSLIIIFFFIFTSIIITHQINLPWNSRNNIFKIICVQFLGTGNIIWACLMEKIL